MSYAAFWARSALPVPTGIVAVAALWCALSLGLQRAVSSARELTTSVRYGLGLARGDTRRRSAAQVPKRSPSPELAGPHRASGRPREVAGTHDGIALNSSEAHDGTDAQRGVAARSGAASKQQQQEQQQQQQQEKD